MRYYPDNIILPLFPQSLTPLRFIRCGSSSPAGTPLQRVPELFFYLIGTSYQEGNVRQSKALPVFLTYRMTSSERISPLWSLKITRLVPSG